MLRLGHTRHGSLFSMQQSRRAPMRAQEPLPQSAQSYEPRWHSIFIPVVSAIGPETRKHQLLHRTIPPGSPHAPHVEKPLAVFGSLFFPPTESDLLIRSASLKLAAGWTPARVWPRAPGRGFDPPRSWRGANPNTEGSPCGSPELQVADVSHDVPWANSQSPNQRLASVRTFNLDKASDSDVLLVRPYSWKTRPRWHKKCMDPAASAVRDLCLLIQHVHPIRSTAGVPLPQLRSPTAELPHVEALKTLPRKLPRFPNSSTEKHSSDTILLTI